METSSKKDVFKFNFHSDIKSNYTDYLKKLDDLLTESKKAKYSLVTKKNKFILTKNGKEQKVLERPFYYNIDEMIDELKAHSKKLYYEIIKLKRQYVQNPDTKNKIKELIDDYRAVQTTLVNIKTYDDEINSKSKINIEINILEQKKIEIKNVLAKLYKKIISENKEGNSIKELCIEFNQINQIHNIDTQIRELKEKENIKYLIQDKKPVKIEPISEEIIIDPPKKESNEITDLLNDIPELELNDDLDELAKQAEMNDHEEISFYDNKPDVPPEDLVIPPIEFIEQTDTLQKKLLAPVKTKKIRIKKPINFNSKTKKYNELSNYYGGVEACYVKKQIENPKLKELLDKFEACSKEEFEEYYKQLQPEKKNITQKQIDYWTINDEPIRGILSKLVGNILKNKSKKGLDALKKMVNIDELKILPEVSDEEKEVQMKECLMEKFQDPKYKEILLKTGNAKLHEKPIRGDHSIWTFNGEKGGDLQGKLLMEIRKELS